MGGIWHGTGLLQSRARRVKSLRRRSNISLPLAGPLFLRREAIAQCADALEQRLELRGTVWRGIRARRSRRPPGHLRSSAPRRRHRHSRGNRRRRAAVVRVGLRRRGAGFRPTRLAVNDDGRSAGPAAHRCSARHGRRAAGADQHGLAFGDFERRSCNSRRTCRRMLWRRCGLRPLAGAAPARLAQALRVRAKASAVSLGVKHGGIFAGSR